VNDPTGPDDPNDASAAVDAVVDAIDAANGEDPTQVVFNGQAHPRARLQGERAAYWVRRLEPSASDELCLAAHAHHLRRWEVPRSSYPSGRAGYLRWRRDLKARHAEGASVLMAEQGFDAAAQERVGALLRRGDLDHDHETQVLEDAVCLTFLETQFEETRGRLSQEKMVDVLAKTLRKMRPQGRSMASEVDLSPAQTELLAQAVEVLGEGG
jgi:hypothetical protein